MNTIDNRKDEGIIGYFSQNPVAANLMMAIMMFGGFVSALGLTAQVFPTIDPGIISVSVAYPGATPSEVEEGITRRVEEAVAGVDGVKRVTSRASENLGSISIETKDFSDTAKVRVDVESAIEQLSDFPPEQAEKPNIVSAVTVSDVLTIVMSSDRTEKELRQATELLEGEILALPSVSMVNLMGAREYEISIQVTEESLRRFNLTIEDVAQAIRGSSINLSSGELKTEAGDVLIRTNHKRLEATEFENIVLRANTDGSVLLVKDVAVVHDGFVEVDLINRFNNQDSLFIKVQKSDSEDALVIGKEVKALLDDYPVADGIQLQIWDDQTEVLKDRVDLLLRNGLFGFALVFLFLVLMLDLKLALWVAMGVPISFLGAFLFFDGLGININMISLFALIIVLGIVVDDAVVVGESIIYEQEQGKSRIRAVLDGISNVIGPVTVGVLTTMAAFAPLLFVTGTFGQILGAVPIVVIAVLSMSLLEAFLILPAHLSHGGYWSRYPLDAIQAYISKCVEHFRDRYLELALKMAVKFRYITLLAGVLLLIGAGSLLGNGAVRFIFFPALESNTIRATVEFPIGTSFDVTRRAAEDMVIAAKAVNQEVGGSSFDSLSVTIGGVSRAGGGPSGGSRMTIASHLASIKIQLANEPLRTLSAAELEKRWRSQVGEIAGVERLSFVSEFFSGGADVEYELAHQNSEVLSQAVNALKKSYADILAVYEIQDSESLGKRQYDIDLTPAGIAAGLTPADVAIQLRRNFFGEEVQRIQRGREELKVMVRYPQSQRNSQRDFFNARIELANGEQVPLSTVAKVTETRGLSAINRVDGLRIVSVTGQVDNDMATPTEVNYKITASVLPQLKQDYPGLQVIRGGSSSAQSEDIDSLGRMMLISLMVIYALMASLLRSYGQPLIILTGVPFGAAGAVVGHYLLGFDLSFISIFGMVALSGVVVNDSLVLIDRYNKERLDPDVKPKQAIVIAAKRRFRAIFLTTATTALGLTPMLFETSTQAQFLVPMAVSFATGIVFASLIILFLVPALVIIREDFRRPNKANHSQVDSIPSLA